MIHLPRPTLFATVLMALSMFLPNSFAAAASQSSAGGDAGGRAAEAPATLPTTGQAAASTVAVPEVDYEFETLDNGLRVIYAPMSNAPVVHVRVLYHVGSKDETPDRQGFAHMFEHMMFRGSAHVPSERHMELINGVGGNSNAFTSFDQTTYVNTVPSNALEMALWLEADRMASFKVDPETFVTERNVVNEEYLQRVVAPPYGRLFMDFFDLAYNASHYQWTPIGDMEQLRQAQPQELQAFFDTYYPPNNAVLTIAGKFEVDEAKAWVREYFGWIPSGEEIDRRSPQEPQQQEPQRRVVYQENIPLPRIVMGFKTTVYEEPDQEVLEVLGNILGHGRSSRLYQALVAGSDPVANTASAGNQRLEDTGLFFVSIGVLPGKDPDEAEQRAMETLRRVAEEGVSEDELAKAKTQLRLQMLNDRQTATSIATILAEAEAFGGDAALVNDAAERLDGITAEDVQQAAQKYLRENRLSVLQYRPGTGPATAPADPPTLEQPERNVPRQEAESMTRPATQPAAGKAVPIELANAHYIAAQSNAEEAVDFPDDYPTTAPIPQSVIDAEFDMGEAETVGPVDVIVIHDDRLPLVGMTLLLPGGSDAAEKGKEGIGSLTADLLTRGAGGMSAAEWSEALESRGITLSVSDGGDHTRIDATFPADQAEATAGFLDLLLSHPNFDEGEFRNLKLRALAGLQQSLSNPSGVVGREMSHALFGDTPTGRSPDLQSVGSITLDDVKAWYEKIYRAPSATMILAGDIDQETAAAVAAKLEDDLQPEKSPEEVDYTLPPDGRRVIIVDNKGGGQSALRLGSRAFTVHNDDKFAASIATEILSSGIESRLNRYLRAEKGLTYGASGRFSPGRHTGNFQVGLQTKPSTTGEAVRSAFEVLERMANEPVTDEELADAKRRVTGSLVMSTQTVGQLASLRSNIALNDYPLDYYDTYADNIAAVTKEDVQRVMREYATPEKLTVVVVGPAAEVAPQLEGIADVEIVPMPLER